MNMTLREYIVALAILQMITVVAIALLFGSISARIRSLENELQDVKIEARFAVDLTKLNVVDIERLRKDLGPDFLPFAHPTEEGR